MDVCIYQITNKNRVAVMIRSEKEYIRLPGRAFSMRTRARLYMGKDHLLSVHNAGYTESYKRFYFKDIQAILAQKTTDGVTWSIAFAIGTVAWILMALIIDEPVFSFFFGWLPAGVLLLSFLINVLRGTTCVSYIYTAVTTEKLRSLSRLRNAQRVMNQVRPFIDNAQGRLTDEALSEKVAALTGDSTAEIKQRTVQQEKIETARFYNGRFHEILFYVLFLFGLQDFMKFFFNHSALSFFGWLIFLAIGALVIIAIVKQHTSIMRKERWLVGITWSTLCYLFIYFNVSYFMIIFASLKNPELVQHELEMIKIFAQRSPLENIYILSFYIVSMVYCFATVTMGLFLLQRYKHEIAGHR
jgi:hypothetical protein